MRTSLPLVRMKQTARMSTCSLANRIALRRQLRASAEPVAVADESPITSSSSSDSDSDSDGKRFFLFVLYIFYVIILFVCIGSVSDRQQGRCTDTVVSEGRDSGLGLDETPPPVLSPIPPIVPTPPASDCAGAEAEDPDVTLPLEERPSTPVSLFYGSYISFPFNYFSSSFSFIFRRTRPW